MTGFKDAPLIDLDDAYHKSDVYVFVAQGKGELIGDDPLHADLLTLPSFQATGSQADDDSGFDLAAYGGSYYPRYGADNDDDDDELGENFDQGGVYFPDGSANSFGDNYLDADETSIGPFESPPIIHYGLETDWGLG